MGPPPSPGPLAKHPSEGASPEGSPHGQGKPFLLADSRHQARPRAQSRARRRPTSSAPAPLCPLAAPGPLLPQCGARERCPARGQAARPVGPRPVPPSPPTKPLPHAQAPAFSPGVALSTQDPCPAKTTSLGPIQALGTPRPGPRTRGRETLGASQGGCRTQGWRGAWLWSRGGLGCGCGGAGSGTGCLSTDPALAPGEARGRPYLPGPEAPTLGSGGWGLQDGGL